MVRGTLRSSKMFLCFSESQNVYELRLAPPTPSYRDSSWLK